MIGRMTIVGALVLALALAPGGCANTEPFEYKSDNEAKSGRGVFTGEDGTWTIFRKPMPAEPAAEQSEGDGGPSGEKAGEGDQEAAKGSLRE